MADYSKHTDAELAALLAQSNQAAFTEIHSRFRAPLYAYAYKLLKNADEAEDLVQEIFIYLWDKREGLVLKKDLSGYLYSAAQHKFFNLLDHKKVVSRYEASFNQFVGQQNFITDNQVRANELGRLIEQEVARLPKKMRQVFELSRNQNLSQKEIAERLNISDKTVKKQMNNAIKILKVKFGSFFTLVISVL